MHGSGTDEQATTGRSASRRILVVSPWGLRGQYSGPVTLMNRLFGALKDLGGFEIDVVHRDRGRESDAPWAHRTFALLRTPVGQFSRVDQLRWALRARRFLRRHAQGYDLVHLQGAYLANVLAVPSKVRGKVVLLPVLEDGDLATGTRFSAVKVAVYRRVIGESHLGLALSTGIAEALIGLGLPRKRVMLIDNPAGGDRRGAPRRQRDDAPFTVGFVGKIGPNKNPHLVLDAIAALREQGVEAHALFVGPFANASFEDSFRSRAGELHLEDKVTFTGFTDDVVTQFGEMDVFVLPSRHEGMPGALAEALTAGLPAVVSDVGQMGDHVRGAHAGFVVRADVSSVLEALLELQDKEVRQRFGRNAREYGAKHFTAAGIAATVRDKLDELEEERSHEA